MGLPGAPYCAPQTVATACIRLALLRARLPHLPLVSPPPLPLLPFTQRHLEILLYQRFDGGSSGAIWKALNNSGLQSTSLNASRKAVDDGFLLEVELAQIMSVFKLNLPAECCDPSQLGRIRSATLLPLATAASVCRQHGRSTASMAWLRAFAQVSVPRFFFFSISLPSPSVDSLLSRSSPPLASLASAHPSHVGAAGRGRGGRGRRLLRSRPARQAGRARL